VSKLAPTLCEASSGASVVIPMPYAPVIGIDRQERQTAKADKNPKRQAGVPKERVKHDTPPPTVVPPFAFSEFHSVQGKDQSVPDERMGLSYSASWIRQSRDAGLFIGLKADLFIDPFGEFSVLHLERTGGQICR
jgi:hypothetical protein